MLAKAIKESKVHVEPFTVVGIAARTSNAREATGSGAIGAMWTRLQTEGFLSRIPHRTDDHVIAVYYDYENGKDGEYGYLLGARVSSANSIPAGMIAKKVESGTYAMFTEEGGPPAQMTVNLWKHIWSLEKPGELERAYKTDYEVHYPNARVDVCVGLAR